MSESCSSFDDLPTAVQLRISFLHHLKLDEPIENQMKACIEPSGGICKLSAAKWDEVVYIQCEGTVGCSESASFTLELKNSWRAEKIEFILIKEDDREADVKKLYAWPLSY